MKIVCAILTALFFMQSIAYAEEPTSSCPTDFVMIEVPSLGFLEGPSCSYSGYTSFSSTYSSSCLDTSDYGYEYYNLNACLMYVLSDTQYKDTIGTYLYTSNCPLE